MNAFRFSSLLALLGLAAVTATAAPDRFERTKARIDALLDRHQKAEALPAKPANPFYFLPPGATLPADPGSAKPVAPTEEQRPVAALADDDQILAYCVARLRVSGQVQRGGVAHLMINSNTYREGDLIPVRGTGETVYYVKVVRVAANEVVFGYNDSVLTIPLKS